VRAVPVTLILALLATAALFVACGDDGGDGGTARQTATPGASQADGGIGDDLVELELKAENTKFDKDRLEAPSGSEISLTFDNRDTVEHNFSLYESPDSKDPLFEGPLVSGPSFLIYQFTAPENPGTYHFHCDVHPDAMKGDFVVD
jgi:plastocyanin